MLGFAGTCPRISPSMQKDKQVHIQDPAVRVRVWQIMETLKQPSTLEDWIRGFEWYMHGFTAHTEHALRWQQFLPGTSQKAKQHGQHTTLAAIQNTPWKSNSPSLRVAGTVCRVKWACSPTDESDQSKSSLLINRWKRSPTDESNQSKSSLLTDRWKWSIKNVRNRSKSKSCFNPGSELRCCLLPPLCQEAGPSIQSLE